MEGARLRIAPGGNLFTTGILAGRVRGRRADLVARIDAQDRLMAGESVMEDARGKRMVSQGAASARLIWRLYYRRNFMTVTQPVLIDCDPGYDDALALMLAAGDPRLEIQGITTVAGNLPLAVTTNNALRLCDLLGLRVLVAAGAAGPLSGPVLTAAHVHGSSGLGDLHLPAPRKAASDLSAVQLLARAVIKWPGRLSVIALGPLSNVAAFGLRHPDLVANLARIVWMGGAVRGGNVTAVAEFNAAADPQALAAVLGFPVPLVIVPLDVTHQVIATDACISRLQSGGAVARAAAELLTYAAAHGGAYLHDPCAVAYALQPDLFGGYTAGVQAVLEPGPERGRTLVVPATAGPMVLEDVQPDGVLSLLVSRLLQH